MKIIIEKEVEGKTKAIKTPHDWLRYAPPRGGKKQWVDGFSAKEFAKYVLNEKHDFGKHIESLLIATGENLLSDFVGIPEATSDLGDGKGKNRKPDLLLEGDKCIISIEAKVNESFGGTIGNAKQSLKTKDERPNYLANYCFPNKIPSNVDSLRYQLFTATVGAIESARRAGKDYAYMLAIEIKEKKPRKITSNDKAFKDFCNALDIQPGEWIIRNGIKCWINKITVLVDTNYLLL